MLERAVIFETKKLGEEKGLQIKIRVLFVWLLFDIVIYGDILSI